MNTGMTTFGRRYRRDACASVVAGISKLPSVRGIACFGSFAMGTCDKHSDLDLAVFCAGIPSSGARKNAIAKLGNVTELRLNIVPHADWNWNPPSDRFRFGGILFDLNYLQARWFQTVIRKVRRGAASVPEMKFRPYTMLGLLENSVILYDPANTLRDMKSRLYPYPARLKQTLLRQSLSSMRELLDELRDFAKRGIGNTAFHFTFDRLIDSMGTALLAINEKYDPATKRVEEVYRQLKILPHDCLKRYSRLLKTSLTSRGRNEIVRELGLIVHEIEELAVKGRKGHYQTFEKIK